MINSNPETVSTDFDTCNRLYFEPLDEESVRDILENENAADRPSADGRRAVHRRSSAGRPPSTWPSRWPAAACPSSARSAETIDLAEDRRRFEDFLDGLGIPQPPGGGGHHAWTRR